MQQEKKSGFLLTGIRFYPVLLLCISLAVAFLTCIVVKNRHAKIDPVHYLKNHEFDKSVPIEKRTGEIPGVILAHMRELDGRSDYKGYTPDSSDMKEIARSLDNIPLLAKTVLAERLIGIYFIRDMIGSGLTEWVIGNDNMFYGFIVINPGSLKTGLSDYITEKEKTCFKAMGAGDGLRVDCGSDYTGFLYIILHESVHLVDYANFLTPFVEDAVLPFRGDIPDSTPFTENIWERYDLPKHDFAGRKNVTFYGLGGGPKIPFSQAAEVYSEVENSPFPSLYASMNWAEDLAEMVTFHHITSILNKPYRISVIIQGRETYSSRPMERRPVKNRLAAIKIFY